MERRRTLEFCKFMENNHEYSMCFTGQLGFDGVYHSS